MSAEVERARAVLKEVSERVVPVPGCPECVPYRPGAGPPGEYWDDPMRNAWVKLCASCSARRPFSWAVNIAPQDFLDWVNARDPGGAWPIDDLKVLLPKRGFEFL